MPPLRTRTCPHIRMPQAVAAGRAAAGLQLVLAALAGSTAALCAEHEPALLALPSLSQPGGVDRRVEAAGAGGDGGSIAVELLDGRMGRVDDRAGGRRVGEGQRVEASRPAAPRRTLRPGQPLELPRWAELLLPLLLHRR